jgi:hypothetical protein
VPDGSQASWPLGGGEVAGSGFVPLAGPGPVPSPLGVRGGSLSQASRPLGGAEVAGSDLVPSSPGQVLCQARWVRLRAARWARRRAAPAGSGSVPRPLGVRGKALCPMAPRHRGLWAAPRSLGQALCQARWVRLRAARWARPRAQPLTRLCKGGRPSRLFYASLVGIEASRNTRRSGLVASRG